MTPERRAAIPLPPVQGTTPGIGLTRLATSVTAASVQMSTYPNFFGKTITLRNEGTDAIWFAFAANASTTLVKGSTAGATIAAGTLAANGYKLAGAASMNFCLNTTDHAYLHFQADANTPTLAIFPASPGVER